MVSCLEAIPSRLFMTSLEPTKEQMLERLVAPEKENGNLREENEKLRKENKRLRATPALLLHRSWSIIQTRKSFDYITFSNTEIYRYY
jgi:hypothetical protein